MIELPLFIHVGMPKTGTSVLQNCVASGVGRGDLKSLFYPSVGRGNGIAHHALAVASLNCDFHVREALISELLIAASQTSNCEVRCGLISSESLSNVVGQRVVARLIDFLRPLAGLFDVRIVAVVREFASFLESMYLQQSRFGRTEKTFSEYISLRGKWVLDFVRGLQALREEFGSRLIIEMHHPSFDVLGFFESTMRLVPGQLTALRKMSPPTSKGSLKLQSCLAHLGKVEDRLGFRIDRLALIREANRREIFSDDTDDYTLYANGELEQRWEEYRDISVRLGFIEYVSAYARPPNTSKPTAVLSTYNLSSDDYVALSRIYGIIKAPAH